MGDFTCEQLEELYKDICPHCAKVAKLRQRTDTKEFVHDFINSTGMSHTFCLASNLRNKHQGVLNG